MEKNYDISDLIASILAELQKDRVLPDPDNLLYYNLEKDRKIFLDFDVGVNLMQYVREIISWNMEDKDIPVEERQPIWLYIMSYGGDVDYMWTMIDTIAMSKTPVYTVNVGSAHSAASLIFMAGKKRYALPNSRVIIHEGSATASGDSQKFQDAAASYKAEVKRMREWIVAHSSITTSNLQKHKANDWEILPEEAVKLGICDEIATSVDDII